MGSQKMRVVVSSLGGTIVGRLDHGESQPLSESDVILFERTVTITSSDTGGVAAEGLALDLLDVLARQEAGAMGITIESGFGAT